MIENKLRELGILLPIPPKSAGSYIPVVVSGNLVFVSGQIPIERGQLKYQGKVKIINIFKMLRMQPNYVLLMRYHNLTHTLAH
uniref:Endoribonuclease L-PSP n=2 Tax=environmental samples TaxID=651140 RepID=A0A075FY83_9ARCH|nr:Endoribonuclease L-PSP [uncultured marine thaumarchaeote AD1000_46_C12]AIE94489.1 Endoribonuclease L-PSP [uncultured marine thaumarchaeote AD1000_46_F05]